MTIWTDSTSSISFAVLGNVTAVVAALPPSPPRHGACQSLTALVNSVRGTFALTSAYNLDRRLNYN